MGRISLQEQQLVQLLTVYLSAINYYLIGIELTLTFSSMLTDSDLALMLIFSFLVTTFPS